MKYLSRWAAALAPALILLIAACSSGPASTATPLPPTPTAAPRLLTVPDAPPSQAEQEREAAIGVLAQFSSAFDEVSAEWDAFRQGFDVWQSGIAGCSANDRRVDLDIWVVEFQPVVQEVTALDFPSGTGNVRTALAFAISDEGAGLRALRDTWEPGSNEAFTAYEGARTDASVGRQEARALLAEAVAVAENGGVLDPDEQADPPLADAAELRSFQEAMDAATAGWGAFHRRYDAWREADGSCAQAAVRDRLAGFASDSQTLLAKAADTARPSVARPLGERLIEAATLETQGLRTLRDTWAAYDQSPWDAIAGHQSEADQLRRQVHAGIDELKLEFGLPLTNGG